MGNLVFQATLGGQVNLVGPNTASTFNINVPTVNGNLVTTGDTGTVTNTMLASSAYTAPGTIGSGTPNTGAFTTLSASGVASFAAGSASAPALTRTGDTNTGMFFPAADTIAFAEGGVEAMRLDSSGNMGLGTTSPVTRLHVSGSSSDLARFQGASRSAYVYQDSGGVGFSSASNLTGQAIYFNDSVNAMRFYTDSTERMRLDASGNLGVGTTSPSYRLDITAAASNNGVAAVRAGSGYASYVSIAGNGTTPLSTSFDLIQDSTNAYIYQRANAPMVFGTNNTERARIDSSGNLLVGATSQVYSGKQVNAFSGVTHNGLALNETANTSNTTYIGFLNGGTAIGSVGRVGATSAVVYNTTSDQRLKSNIEDAAPVLNKLMQVQVRQYDWTEGDLHQDYGFIAQELEPVLSGVVTKGKTEEDFWQLDYARLTPHLVKAIQELKAELDAAKARITALEA